MKRTFYLVLFFTAWGFSQTSLTANLVESIPLECSRFIGVDQFESIYYLESNILFKKTKKELQNYSVLDKGNLSSVSVFNPLKLALFYKDFNSVTLLDNRLADLISVDFNHLTPLQS